MAHEGFDAGLQPELPRLDEHNVVAIAPGGPAPGPLEPPQSIFTPVQEDTDLNVAARSPSQTSEAGNGSLVSRAQRKSQALRDYFGLPTDEEFQESFNCALRQKILLQGHLYIFTHHICFYSNIFGYLQKRVIPFKDVVCIRKRRNLGLPNSIEVEHAGQNDLFTSFLNRKEAYRLMVDCWGNSSNGALVLSASQRVVHKAAEGEDRADSSNGSVGGRWVRHCVSAKALDPAHSSSSSPSRRALEAASFSSSRPRRSDDSDGSPTALDRVSIEAPAPLARGNDESAPAPAQQADQDQDGSLPKLSVGDTDVATSRVSRAKALAPTPTEDQEASPPEPPQRDESLSLIPGDPPPLAKGMTSTAEGTWDFSVRDSLTRVFSDQSPFWTEWHRSRGDGKVQLSPWQNMTGSDAGRIRQLTFVTPLAGALRGLPMAPKEAPCQQTHRLQLFSGERLVFESTQHISGIPMGDLFRVEARYDVTNCGTPQSPQCQIKTYVRVVFSKSTWLKGTIEKHTLAAVKDSQADFIVKAGQATGIHMSPFQAQSHKGPKSLARKGSGGIPIHPLGRRNSGQLDRRRSSQLSRQLSGSMRGDSGRQRASGHSMLRQGGSINEDLPESPAEHRQEPREGREPCQDPRAAALRGSHEDGAHNSPKSMRHTHSFSGPNAPHKSPLGPGTPTAADAGARGMLGSGTVPSGTLPVPALCLAALVAVIALQVIILLRPAQVQVQYTAPTAAHLAGVLQHVETMLSELSAMHKQLKAASLAPR